MEMDHLEELGQEYLNGCLRSGDRDLEWIDLAQDRDKWRAVVSVVTNLHVQ